MTKREIERQISEYEDGGLTRTNARDLSALYIIRDNLFPDAPATPERAALPLSASFAGAPDVVPEYGDKVQVPCDIGSGLYATGSGSLRHRFKPVCHRFRLLATSVQAFMPQVPCASGSCPSFLRFWP